MYYNPVCQLLPKRLPLLRKKVICSIVLIALIYLVLSRRQQVSITSHNPPVASFIIHSARNNSSGGHAYLGSIPKIIHQTWKSQDAIPETFRPWMESWIKLNSDWEYWFWTDEDINVLMSKIFPEYLSLYNSYPSQFYRVDAFRYFLLYVHGGLYADLDMECLRPLDEITEQDECIISQEPLEHAHFLSHLGPPLVSNALMACKPQHSFFAHVISHLNSYAGIIFSNDILHATGPFMLTEVFQKYHRTWPFWSEDVKSKVRLANPDEFQPHPDNSMVDHMRRMCENSRGGLFSSESFAERQKKLCSRLTSHDFGYKINPTSYTNHHWTHTWAGKYHDPWGVHNMRIRFSVSDLLSVHRT